MRRLLTFVFLLISAVTYAQAPTPLQSEVDAILARYAAHGSTVTSSERAELVALLKALRAKLAATIQDVLNAEAGQSVVLARIEAALAANRAPIVNAGPDRAIALPAVVTFAATASDPDGDAITRAWSMVSGPAPPIFTATNVSFTAPGQYVLRLTVSDSQLTTFDELTVIVTPIVPPPPPPPTACMPTTLPMTVSVPAAATNGSFPMVIGPTCAWTATVTPGDGDWFQVSPASGAGPATITYHLNANPLTVPRSSTLSVNAFGILFTQQAPGVPPPPPPPPPGTQALLKSIDVVNSNCYFDLKTEPGVNSSAAGLAGGPNGTVYLLSGGQAVEISLAGKPCGAVITVPVRRWPNVGGGSHVTTPSIIRGELWTAATENYVQGADMRGSEVYSRTMNAGTFGPLVKRSLNITQRRAFGAIAETPAAWQSAYGLKPFLMMGGGALSLITNGPIALGPAIHSFDSAGNVQSLADSADPVNQRGRRLTLPTNYGDKGDNRPNGSNGPRPTFPPIPGAQFTSPDANGFGVFTQNDSYWGAACVIDRPSMRGILMAASLAKGAYWYCNSDVCWDARQFELHVFDPADNLKVQAGTLRPWQIVPASMHEIAFPGLGGGPAKGLVPEQNINGMTCDNATGTIYLGGGLPGVDTYRVMRMQVP